MDGCMDAYVYARIIGTCVCIHRSLVDAARFQACVCVCVCVFATNVALVGLNKRRTGGPLADASASGTYYSISP